MGLGSIGFQELLLILFILLIIFGGKKLPELAHGLGKSIREFKKAVKEEEEPRPKGELSRPQAETNVHAEKQIPQQTTE
ncbi:MAG: twin-arginine translocase TatA/TatE family subunit [candidate division KSB1 bacterium]|nr:twin-arginine translocase TatA/TatE family subunit [candidate division KSB1 bacterium]